MKLYLLATTISAEDVRMDPTAETLVGAVTVYTSLIKAQEAAQQVEDADLEEDEQQPLEWEQNGTTWFVASEDDDSPYVIEEVEPE